MALGEIMKKNNVQKIILSAVLLCLGIVLPFFTGQIKEIGDSLLPMHLPVFLCGFLCGFKYGGTIGLLLPFMRSFIFSMPPVYPNAVWMALELCAYGAVSGFLYGKGKKRSILYTYFCLVSSMLCGRIVWGISKTVLLGLSGKATTFAAFISGGFIDALPGIILQLIFIPVIVKFAEKHIA